MAKIRPTIDVSDAIDSIEFIDSFDVIKRMQTVDDHGIAHDASITTYCVLGIVEPNASLQLMIFPEGERLSGSITIYSQYRLTSGKSHGRDADLVIWNDREFIVDSVEPWTHFGLGYTKAVCVLHTLNPVPT